MEILTIQAIFDVRLLVPWRRINLTISLSLVIQERHWVRYSGVISCQNLPEHPRLLDLPYIVGTARLSSASV
jgi:hypothetical protein